MQSSVLNPLLRLKAVIANRHCSPSAWSQPYGNDNLVASGIGRENLSTDA
jgi:hypothetical protein